MPLINAPVWNALNTGTISAFDAVGEPIPTVTGQTPPPQPGVRMPDPRAGRMMPFGGMFGTQFTTLGATPALPTPLRPINENFVVPSDLYTGPYVQQGQLDQYSNTTPAQRWLFVHLYLTLPEVAAAIDSKVNAVASANFSTQPENWERKADRDAVKLCEWAIRNCRGGTEGLVRDMLIGAFLQGTSAVEIQFRPGVHPILGPATGICLASRSLDMTYLGLELDPYRNIMGIVSLRRGLETFASDQLMIYAHNALFANPFGNSDLRPLIVACNALIETDQIWTEALELYGSGYLVGTTTPGKIQEMANTLSNVRSYGYAAVTKDEKIEMLSLAAAGAWQAFSDRLDKARERIYLKIRGAFLPFVEGSGETDKRGNTSIHASTSDLTIDLPARAVGRMIRDHIFKKIVEWNFGPEDGRPVGVPYFEVGGTDLEETKNFMDVVLKAKKELNLPISRKYVNAKSGLPPPEDQDDVFELPADPDAGGGPGGGAEGSQAPPSGDGKEEVPGSVGPGVPKPGEPGTPGAKPPVMRLPPPGLGSVIQKLIAEPIGGMA